MRGRTLNKRIFAVVAFHLFICIFFFGGACLQALHAQSVQEAVKQRIAELNKIYLEYADEYFDADSKKIFRSENYVVITDHAHPEVAQATASLFEDYRKGYLTIFEKVLEQRAMDYPTHILLFRNINAFRLFSLKAGLNITGEVQGFYISGTSIIISHFGHSSERDFLAALIHEGVHQLNDQFLFKDYARRSIWISEGLANYFAFMKLDKTGTLIAGKIDRNCLGAAGLINKVKRAMSVKKHVSIEDLIAAGYGEFHGKESLLLYGESWLFVRFLLHHDNGKYQKMFLEYLGYEADGKGGLENFKKIFGSDLSVMEKEFRKYVRRIY